MTDLTEPNSGATLFVRKSHSFPEPLAIPKGEVDPPVFENRIYHAPALTSPIRSPGGHLRLSLLLGKPDYYLQYYNDKLQPDEPLLAKLDDVSRQLLGA